MKILFLSSGRRAKEIIYALRKRKISVSPVIKGNCIQTIYSLLFKQYDIIHADSLQKVAVASIISKLRKKKCTCLIRGYGAHSYKKERYRRWFQIYLSICEKIALRLIDHIFFISKDAQNVMLKNFNIIKPFSIAHNGVNIIKSSETKNIRKYVSENHHKNIKIQDTILISVTNFDIKQKAAGLNILNDTMKSLPHNIWLIVLGHGKYFNVAKKNATNNVIFVGYKKDVQSWLKGSDIFVYCSFLDSWGQIIIEAQITGLPIIASRIGGIPETTKYATLIEPNKKEFRKAINKYIQFPQEKDKQGKKNKKWIKKRNWDWAIAKYLKVWEQIILK